MDQNRLKCESCQTLYQTESARHHPIKHELFSRCRDQSYDKTIFDPTWEHPFTCIVSGPTGCGKTEWVKRFIHHLQDLVRPSPTQVVWSYAEWQPAYHSLPDSVTLVQGLPDIPMYSKEPQLVVIDDQMDHDDNRISNLFTKGSHHRNISVIYIVQNLFDKNKQHRTISLNAHYLVVFKNPRDGSQIVHLAKQMYPGKTRYVQHAFELATRQAHGYLVIDLKQSTPEIMRLRSKIFPDEIEHVYVESN